MASSRYRAAVNGRSTPLGPERDRRWGDNDTVREMVERAGNYIDTTAADSWIDCFQLNGDIYEHTPTHAHCHTHTHTTRTAYSLHARMHIMNHNKSDADLVVKAMALRPYGVMPTSYQHTRARRLHAHTTSYVAFSCEV